MQHIRVTLSCVNSYPFEAFLITVISLHVIWRPTLTQEYLREVWTLSHYTFSNVVGPALSPCLVSAMLITVISLHVIWRPTLTPEYLREVWTLSNPCLVSAMLITVISLHVIWRPTLTQEYLREVWTLSHYTLSNVVGPAQNPCLCNTDYCNFIACNLQAHSDSGVFEGGLDSLLHLSDVVGPALNQYLKNLLVPVSSLYMPLDPHWKSWLNCHFTLSWMVFLYICLSSESICPQVVHVHVSLVLIICQTLMKPSGMLLCPPLKKAGILLCTCRSVGRSVCRYVGIP